ncbi:ATP-dependent dethiobiotin synthetase BioD [Gottschalkia purinilytica]|uniref:ATP-dependent dethiobiotin synthetase BioD n=1 Tax=Gottschalkia purinilytica TaxID=1503 RepID=A0A0L0W9L5_GOTPU|nr:dethiobiotin synthase [Gottschalkia purinilytica]KNF08248.1 ATP-dependent dethiobiotin synthetase BioD [Gottschalkia purinilytica]
MSKSIFIVGTDTDVGKTFVSGGIVYTLKKNEYSSCYFKPIQSGGETNDGKCTHIDVDFVKKVANISEDKDYMNSYCLKEPLSPHLAFKVDKINFKKNKIMQDLQNLKNKYEYVIIEGAGGVVVPLIRDNYYIYDLIRDIDSSVVIVTKSKVGTINHTVLTVEFLKNKGINIKGIIVNDYKGNFYEDDNIETIKNITGLEIISIIRNVKSKDNDFYENIKKEYDRSFDVNKILKVF